MVQAGGVGAGAGFGGVEGDDGAIGEAGAFAEGGWCCRERVLAWCQGLLGLGLGAADAEWSLLREVFGGLCGDRLLEAVENESIDRSVKSNRSMCVLLLF